jgi:hypothetical protein
MDTHKDQQELDGIWRPYSEKLGMNFPGAETVPQWLNSRYAGARRAVAR